MGEEIAIHLLADFLFLILLYLVGTCIHWATRRQQVRRFFRVNKSERFMIYLSNIRVLSGGSVGIDNKPRSFMGFVVAWREVQIAHMIRDVFSRPLPFLADTPEWLRGVLVADIDARMELSPLALQELDAEASFIALGSPAYNIASKFVETQRECRVHFREPDGTIDVAHVPPIDDPTCGFIQRILLKEANRALFYAAGQSELGTIGAAYYLAKSWRKLQKDFGSDKDFVVMLKFIDGDIQNPNVLFKV